MQRMKSIFGFNSKATTLRFGKSVTLETRTSGQENDTRTSGQENFPREFGAGGIAVQGLVTAVKDINCNWDYIKLYIDEVTNGDADFEAWIKYNAHMQGDSPAAIYIVQAYGSFVPKLSLVMQQKLQGENVQFHLYKSKNPEDNSIYLSSNNAFSHAVVEGKNELDIKQVGDGKNPVATFNMLIKATKTQKGIVTTVEYANFIPHHPELEKAFKQYAKEKNLPLIPDVISPAVISEEDKILAEKNLIVRLNAVIDSLVIEDDARQTYKKDPLKHIVEIMQIANEQKKSKSSVANVPSQPEELKLTPQQIQENEIFSAEFEKKAAILKKVSLLRGLSELDSKKYTASLVESEREIDAKLDLQKRLLAEVELYSKYMPAKTLERYQANPLGCEKEIGETVSELSDLVEKINSLKGLDQEEINKFLTNPLQYKGHIIEYAEEQEYVLRILPLIAKNISPKSMRAYLDEPLKYADQIKKEYIITLTEKIKTLRIDSTLKELYLDDPMKFAEEIEVCSIRQRDLLRKVDLLEIVSEQEKKEFEDNPFLFKTEITHSFNLQREKYEIIHNFMGIVSARINRLLEFIEDMPKEEPEQNRSKMFSSGIREQALVDEHIPTFVSLKHYASSTLKKEINALEEMNAESIKFILLDVLDNILSKAKSDMVVAYEKASSLSGKSYVLSKESYVFCLMRYIEELKKDLTVFYETASVHVLILDGRDLPQPSDKVTKQQIAENLKTIKAEVHNEGKNKVSSKI